MSVIECTVLSLFSDNGEVKKRRRTYSDSAADSKAETEYLRTARRGGGHKGMARLFSILNMFNFGLLQISTTVHSRIGLLLLIRNQ